MLEDKIKFSVIIPLYNKSAFISDTIDSVLGQTYPWFEIIVVDDGSTDDSIKVVEAINDNRIKIHTKKNGGVSSARNYGIKKASYPYVAFIDADDVWENSFLEEIYMLIKKYPEASVFCTNYKLHYIDSKTVVNNKNLPSGLWDDYFKLSLTGTCITWTSACCVREEALFNVGLFNEAFSMGEDLDLWFRLAEKYKFAYSPKALSNYNRCDENGLVNSFNDDPAKSWLFNIHASKINNKSYSGRYLETLVADKIITYIFNHKFGLVKRLSKQYRLGKFRFLRFVFVGINRKVKRKIYKTIAA